MVLRLSCTYDRALEPNVFKLEFLEFKWSLKPTHGIRIGCLHQKFNDYCIFYKEDSHLHFFSLYNFKEDIILKPNDFKLEFLGLK